MRQTAKLKRTILFALNNNYSEMDRENFLKANIYHLKFFEREKYMNYGINFQGLKLLINIKIAGTCYVHLKPIIFM